MQQLTDVLLGEFAPVPVPLGTLLLCEEAGELSQQVDIDISEESLHLIDRVCVNLRVEVRHYRLLLVRRAVQAISRHIIEDLVEVLYQVTQMMEIGAMDLLPKSGFRS